MPATKTKRIWSGNQALQRLLVPVDDLRPHPRNPRRGDVAAIQASLERFGQQRPILALPDGTVVAGNHTLRAAREAGWTHIATVRSDLTDAEVEAYLLADNRTGDLGSYDDAALLDLLKPFYAEDALTGTGYEQDDVKRLLRDLARFERGDPEAAPEPPIEPRSKRGEVYALGAHRVMCGDATVEADVAALLGDDVPALCVTDPPYGVNYDPKWRNVEAAKGNLAYAARRVGEVMNDDRADWREAWELFPGDVIYSWIPGGVTSLVHADALLSSGFEIRTQIIWAKSNFPIGRGDYHMRHEPCWYAVRKGRPSRRTKDRTQTTLWEINLDKNVAGGHSTQKPVECMARPIRNHEFDEVYDPFCGSGTSVVAAEMEGARCLAMELDPRYCDVIRQRYADYTGQPEYAP